MANKYHNVKTQVDGRTFDSKREAARYRELALLMKAGYIKHLVLQPRFHLIVNGLKIADYLADFTYLDADGTHVCEDAKGVRTAVFVIKKKLMKAIHGIEVREV